MGEEWEEFELDERDRRQAPVPGYPVWWTRKWTAPYGLDKDQIDRILRENHLCVASWVRSSGAPATAMIDYLWMDGFITVTSTSNRAKYKAWSRNPHACFCIWNERDTQESMNVQGRIEIFRDVEFGRRWIRRLMEIYAADPVSDGTFEEQWAMFDAPDRHWMRLHIDRIVSYDGAKLRRAEREGIDMWGAAKS